MEDHIRHFSGNVAQKALIEHDGKVLVCRGVGDSVWEFPGGRLHADEAPQEGLAREIREELGIEVRVGAPLFVCRSYHRRAGAWQVFIGYRAEAADIRRLAANANEVSEVRFVSREELAALPMFDDCRAMADAYLAG